MKLAATRKNVPHFSCGAESMKHIQSPEGQARAYRPAQTRLRVEEAEAVPAESVRQRNE